MKCEICKRKVGAVFQTVRGNKIHILCSKQCRFEYEELHPIMYPKAISCSSSGDWNGVWDNQIRLLEDR